MADVVVASGPVDPPGRYIGDPMVIAEVLFPSTESEDRGPKLLEYREFATLQHDLLVAPDDPRAWLHTGTDAGRLEEPVAIRDGGTVDLAAVDLFFPLADLY